MTGLFPLRAWRTTPTPSWQRLSRDARRWGVPGGLGALLVGAALLVLLVVVPQGRAALRADEAVLHEARVRAAQARRQQDGQAADSDPLRSFQAGFPAAGERHRRITNLMALAAGLGLQPRRSDVRSLPEAGLGLTRVRVVLPLSGPYASLRRYVDQALREDPALTLDLLRLERSDLQSGELRAELQWSLWMRSAENDVPEAEARIAQSLPARSSR